MREAAFWLSGAALAFFLTAGAFLLLANLATVPSERSLAPDPPRGRIRAAVELALDAEQLASSRPGPDQSLDLAVRERGRRAPIGRERDPDRLLREHRPRGLSLLPADDREGAAGETADVHFELRPLEP